MPSIYLKFVCSFGLLFGQTMASEWIIWPLLHFIGWEHFEINLFTCAALSTLSELNFFTCEDILLAITISFNVKCICIKYCLNHVVLFLSQNIKYKRALIHGNRCIHSSRIFWSRSLWIKVMNVEILIINGIFSLWSGINVENILWWVQIKLSERKGNGS